MVKYDDLLIVPRDEDEHDEAAMEKAWKAAEKAGFDLNRIVTGGDPFSEADDFINRVYSPGLETLPPVWVRQPVRGVKI